MNKKTNKYIQILVLIINSIDNLLNIKLYLQNFVGLPRKKVTRRDKGIIGRIHLKWKQRIR